MGGGPAASSAYTANYVPKVIVILEAQHLSGYAWGGVSQGTIANAEMVTDHPTNLAVGQSDLFALIKDQSRFPGREGTKYQFTVVKPDMGPECLDPVTNDKSYKTFGDVVGNGWQLGVVTGGEKSGSFGTWKVLQGVYPDLGMAVTHFAAIDDIITAVKQKKDVVGFFVMRPDSDSDVFKSIADASLTIVPVVDFDLFKDNI